MKLKDYVPMLYEDNVEMQQIYTTEQTDLENKLKTDIRNSFRDIFPKVATERGLEMYEKILGIQLDENRNNLEYRRARVIGKLTTTVPLTQRWLENNLYSMVGEDNYSVEVDYDNYSLTINIADEYLNTALTLYSVYRPLVPSNMTITVNTFGEQYAHSYTATLYRETEETTYISERIEE